MMKQWLWIPLSIGAFWGLKAQNGGVAVYSFLKQSPSPRLSALGQSQIAWQDADLALAFVAPSLLNDKHHNALSFNQHSHKAGIKTGYMGYGFHLKSLKTTFQAGIQYAAYGQFKQTDVFGQEQGTVKASEYALVFGAGHAINARLSAGVNLKFISSQLAEYRSSGLAIDLSGTYWQPVQQWGLTVLVRHAGVQISTYQGIKEDLPLDVQVGFSKKLAKAPLRFSIAAHDLNTWRLRYDNPTAQTQTLILGNESTGPSRLSQEVDNFFRHINFGGELLLGKNEPVRLRVGYNHKMRREMAVTDLRSTAGFSFGLGLKISRFNLDYGFGKQHIAGNTHHIGLSTNINNFLNRS